jgi:O-antigen/teichoic acid export membrane protein
MLSLSLRSLRQSKLLKDALALGTGRALNLVVGLVSTLIYGVVFQKTQIAVISLFEMLLGLFISFGFTWSSLGIIRFGKEEHLRNGTINHISTVRIRLILPLLALSILLLVLLRKPFLNYIGSDDASLIYFLIVSIIALVFHDHITSLLTAAEKHVWNAWYYLAESIGKLSILAAFYLGLMEPGAEPYLKISTCLLLVLALLRLPLIERTYLFPFARVDRKDSREFLRFVLPQVYGFAGLYLINWVDLHFIRMYCSLNDLGAYQFMYSLFIKIGSFAFLLNNLFFPKIVAWKESDGSQLRNFLSRFPIVLFLIMLLVAVFCIYAYDGVFDIFFGNKYAVAYPSFEIMLLVIPLHFVTYTLIPVLNTYDKVACIQLVNIVSATVNIAVDYLLIGRIGIMGAALGTFLAYAIKFFMLFVVLDRMFSFRSRPLAVASSVLSMSVIIYVFRALWSFR